MSNNCKWCKDFEFVKKLAKESDKKFNLKESGLHRYYKVCLVEEIYRNRHLTSYMSHNLFKFKYCPVCGKKI